MNLFLPANSVGQINMYKNIQTFLFLNFLRNHKLTICNNNTTNNNRLFLVSSGKSGKSLL